MESSAACEADRDVRTPVSTSTGQEGRDGGFKWFSEFSQILTRLLQFLMGLCS